jgi:hypothetical protein
MKAGVGGCALGVLLVLAPSAAWADAPVAGITIGMAVAAIAARLGPPLRVDSSDAGTAFVFARGRTVYVDDDGMVLAVELRSGTPRIDVDGATRTLAIGTYAAARADAELAGVAEFATPAERSYRLAPRRDLALTFDAGSQRLTRVTYGEPGQLARLGLLPGDGASKAVVYHAPRTLAGAVVPPPAPSAAEPAVFRLAIDRSGAVTEVDDALPSPHTAADAAAARRLRLGRYQPATLDGRPIAATLFVEMRP